MKSFLPFLLGSLFFLTACSQPTPSPAPMPAPQPPAVEPEINLSEYLPLKIGNSWKYEGIGNEFASYTEKVSHQKDNKAQVIRSSGTVTANRYEFTQDSILHTYQQHEFYEDKDILDSPANFNAIILKLPLKVGNSWVSESNTCEIIDTDVSVETPAGTFEKCLAVKTIYKDSGNYSIRYYAKGVGMVKSEYNMPENLKVISQLSSYAVKS